MNKKLLIPVVLIIVLVLAGSAFAFTRLRSSSSDTAETQQKKKVLAPVNMIPVTERPYMEIAPMADGRNVEIRVNSLNKAADSMEYELEYQAGTLLQGAFGELALGTLPVSKTILLGSCSAGGACTYHEDVQGGSIVTRFSGAENYALKSDWKYIDNRAKETQISSRDAKFQLDAAGVATQRYLVIFNTPGYPEGLTGTAVSDPYSIVGSSALQGKGTLIIRANEDGATSIMGYDGKTWQTFETTIEGKALTADVELMQLYVAVK
ncbi:MAG: hypothetical protein M3Q81_00990 [bacterium]|nr:hypothetical protein [bacterium]